MHSDTNLKNIFPENSICTVFKRNRNLKEISPSLYTKRENDKKTNIIKNCGKCNICQKIFWLVIVALFVRLRIRNIILKTTLIVIV